MGRLQKVLTTAQRDRATGAVVGMAVGNALGSGYAFQPHPDPAFIRMLPGGLGAYELGEWADDTAMAMPILEALADGRDLLDPATQDVVASRWAKWFTTAKDVAPNIDRVLEAYDPALGAQSLRHTATAIHAAGTPAAGNASLMRTTPVTLGYLHDPEALAHAARTYSDLTHANPEASEACILWNLAQRRAILSGEFDISGGLDWVPKEHQQYWDHLITQAEIGWPPDFAIRNGRCSHMVQTAWSAISRSDQSGPEHFETALRMVIAAGGDTPTAAAITGSMLGARWGVSAIPLEWRRHIHGWPGLRDVDLLRLVWEANAGNPWPSSFDGHPSATGATAHPRDIGLWIDGTAGLRPLPPGIDAVVSLCPLGHEQTPRPPVAAGDHVNVWLIDSEDPAENPNLELVADQTLKMLLRLRSEGKTVYMHCARGASRTAFIGALYGAHLGHIPAVEALAEIQQAMPAAKPNALFMDFLQRYD